VLGFAVQHCLIGPVPAVGVGTYPVVLAGIPSPEKHTPFLNWQRSSTNPFAAEAERLLAWVQAHPEWSVRRLFEQLELLFPGRYSLAQYPALQRVVRKIRAHLRKQAEEPWSIELIHGPDLGFSVWKPEAHQEFDSGDDAPDVTCSSSPLSLQAPAEASFVPCPMATREEETDPPERASRSGEPGASSPARPTRCATRLLMR
jgi:hypothetical protein